MSKQIVEKTIIDFYLYQQTRFALFIYEQMILKSPEVANYYFVEAFINVPTAPLRPGERQDAPDPTRWSMEVHN